MRTLSVFIFVLLGVLCAQAKYLATGRPYNVSYDHRALVLNGERTLFVSGSVHYPRSTPDMWPSILRQSKLAGVNLIQTYVFWNLHEPTPGNYNWEGYANLPQFLKYCQENELYVNLRIGPYVCAEWNYGGFPIWLKFLDGIVFRDYSAPFMTAMQNWMTYVVNYLKPYFASNGGPIILAQVENEYGWLEKEYGQAGAEYASWAANMANGLGVGIPWIMCSQDNIYTVIDTCNGFYCDGWIPGHQAMFTNQPSLYTENWSGWFQDWTVAKPTRPGQDLAFSVARFIAAGGTHNNYYMWHGGTNFARWSGGPFIVSSYDYDAPLDEYGLPNQPKYDHLTALHNYLNRFASIIVGSDPVYVSYSSTTESHTYGSGANSVAFLSNTNTALSANITYGGVVYTLPPWSVSLVYAGQSLYNTAVLPYTAVRSRVMKPINALGPNSGAIWSWAVEPVGVWGNPIYNPTPLEQLNLTRDTTDYLWYCQSVSTSATTSVTLSLTNTGDLVYLFLNGTMYGFQQGQSDTIKFSFKVPAGTHQVNILSLTVGLINIEPHMEQWSRGLLGPVLWNSINITAPRSGWAHQIGLRGEALGYWNGQNNGSWHANGTAVSNRPMTWYRAEFHLSKSDLEGASLALFINNLGKGFAWVNGNALGRFWNILANGNCTSCHYNQTFSPNNSGCQVGCGEPTQTYYHVPTSWLKEGENLLVLFTESGGSVAGIDLVQRE